MSSTNILFVCPMCKKGEVKKINDSDKNVICDKCKTLFRYNKKKDNYTIQKIGNREFKNSFKNLNNRLVNEKGLKAHEWTNIAKGGRSDKEQKKYDEEQVLIAEQNEEKELLTKINSGDLTNIKILSDVPIMLKKDEKAYLHLGNISLFEEITKMQYEGGSRGVSFRVMKGVSFRVGAFKGERIPVTEKKHIDTGDLVVTNKRVIFTGPSRSVSFPVTKIINIDEYSDGISIHREGKQKTEFFIADIEIPMIKHHSAWTFIKTVIQGVYANI